jgi:phosphate starvation-inducible PhoH-like protein
LPKSASESLFTRSRPQVRSRRHPSSTTQIELAFDDNRAASALVGQYGQNLALLERKLNVTADQRGNHIMIAGSRDGCAAARRVLENALPARPLRAGVAQGDVDGAIRAVIAQGSLFDFDPKAPRAAFEEINLRKRRCAPAPQRRTPISAR